jgi:hypothetical protein
MRRHNLYDPRNDMGFELGMAEYSLALLFDGQRSLNDIADAALAQHRIKVNPEKLAQFERRLLNLKLLSSEQTAHKKDLRDPATGITYGPLKEHLLINLVKTNPQPLLDHIYRLAPWCCRAAFILPVLALALASFVYLGAHFGTFMTDAGDTYIQSYRWLLWHFPVILTSIALHELGHAMACRHYGVKVNDFGIGIYLLLAIGWVRPVQAQWSRLPLNQPEPEKLRLTRLPRHLAIGQGDIGDYEIIVGEVHPAVHTLSQPVAAPFGPFNTQINQQVEAIFQRPRLILADSPDSYQRSHIDWPLQPSYLQLVLPSGGGCVAANQQFAAGRAKVLRVNGRLQVVDALGEFSEDLLCVYSTAMHRLGFALAGSAVAKHEHRRIWLGRTLYKRASWLFTRDRLPEPKGSVDELEHTLQWRAWAADHGLPRYAFIKIDTEPKPLFLDFDNPLSFDGISNALKNAGHAKFSEMRPCPDELWLEEERGRFCCEIRTTFSTCETPAT